MPARIGTAPSIVKSPPFNCPRSPRVSRTPASSVSGPERPASASCQSGSMMLTSFKSIFADAARAPGGPATRTWKAASPPIPGAIIRRNAKDEVPSARNSPSVPGRRPIAPEAVRNERGPFQSSAPTSSRPRSNRSLVGACWVRPRSSTETSAASKVTVATTSSSRGSAAWASIAIFAVPDMFVFLMPSA